MPEKQLINIFLIAVTLNSTETQCWTLMKSYNELHCDAANSSLTWNEFIVYAEILTIQYNFLRKCKIEDGSDINSGLTKNSTSSKEKPPRLQSLIELSNKMKKNAFQSLKELIKCYKVIKVTDDFW